MQFHVPQFLDIEDKIIGPLTLKQFAYLAGGGVLLFILSNYVKLWLFLIIAAPLAAFCMALAFIRVNGRPFISIFGAFVNYMVKPKLFVWKRKEK
ncbi:MAG: PrgI family protein [Candidatus Portnoybacteria bacterium]|nr:PrgI family protein [Candidatus Portnoybacteria bacterium]